MSLRVDRLVTRCEIPRRLDPEARRALVDRVARERLAPACADLLGARWTAQDAVVRIRRLPVRLALSRKDLTEEGLARAWASGFVGALLTTLGGATPIGAPRVEVVMAENRAAWLARFLSHLACGTAAGRWEYDEFREVLGLSPGEATVETLAREPAEIVAVLDLLATHGEIDKVLARLDELALERLFTAMARNFGSGRAGMPGSPVDPALTAEDLVIAGALAALSGQAQPAASRVERRRQALRILVAMRRERCVVVGGSWPPRRIFHALSALAALVEMVGGVAPADWALALDPAEIEARFGRTLPAPATAVLVALGLAASRDFEAALERPRSVESQSDLPSLPPDLPRLVADLYRGRPAGVEEAPARSATRVWPIATSTSRAPALPPSPNSGGSSEPSTTSMPQPLWLASQHAGLFLLVGLLDRLRWPEHLVGTPLGALHGPRAITYALAGLGLAILGRFSEPPPDLDPGLALFAGSAGEVPRAGLLRFFEAATPADRRAMIALLDRDAERLDDLAATWHTTLDHLGGKLVRLFAAQIRGFRRSSRAFVVRNFLARPGRIRVDEAEIAVVLDPGPLDVALHTSAMDTPVGSLSWLGGRRVTFRLEGL